MSGSNESQAEKLSVSRRSYLKAATALTGLSAIATKASASSSNFDIIEVPAGELYRVSLSDGETFENVLFDISAPGARFQIRARANDWTIRNIGAVGHWDSERNSFHPMVLEVPDRNSEGVVENVCFETTTERDTPYANGPGGPYVFRSHAGHIRFERIYLQHFQDNGFYCSSPGRAEGGGGTVEIRDSYVYRCGTSNFRLGEGGELHNCVGVEGYRNFWVQFNEAEAYDCDFLGRHPGGKIGDVVPGSGQDRNAVAVMHNSRWETEGGPGTVVGSSAGAPVHRIPNGCPTTAEQAASGAGSDGDGSSVPEGDFELTFTTNSDLAEYLVELEAAAVEPGADANTHEHEFQDRAFEHEGRWYIHGYTGGGGDNFHVEDGEILRVGQLQGEIQIRADRRRVELDSFDAIEAVPETGGEDESFPARDFELTFTTNSDLAEYLVELEATAVEPGADANTHEHEFQDRAFEHEGRWYIHGYTAGGGDNFHVEGGEILRVGQLQGETRIEADGEVLGLEKFDEIDAVPANDRTHRLEVAGQFEYQIEVDGEIRPLEPHAQWLTEGESYGDDWAEWWLSGADGARTVWEFTGEITELHIDDYDGVTEIRTLAVDDEDIDPDRF